MIVSFARARSLAPDGSDALVGLVASRRIDLTQGSVPEVPEAQLEAPVAAVIKGWRLGDRKDWNGVAALDAELARIAPGDALFREASELRTLWRLETGDRAAGAEGMAIMATVLTYFWHPEDELLHARAAVAAGQPAAASVSLARIAGRALRNDRGRDQARRALAIAEALPEGVEPLSQRVLRIARQLVPPRGGRGPAENALKSRSAVLQSAANSSRKTAMKRSSRCLAREIASGSSNGANATRRTTARGCERRNGLESSASSARSDSRKSPSYRSRQV